MSESVVTGTFSGPALSVRRDRAGAVVVLALDRLLVVGQVGVRPGGLADGGCRCSAVSSPVEPLSPSLVALSVSSFAVDLQVEQCPVVVGFRSFWTSSLPVSRVFVITQTMSLSVVTGTVSGPCVSADLATTAPVPLSSLHSIDFW